MLGGVVVVVGCGVWWWGSFWLPREGGLTVVCFGGGIDINRLVGTAACCVCGLVSGGGGGGGVGVALLVVAGAGVGVVAAGDLSVPVGCVDVACKRRAVLTVPGWSRCRGVGGRRPHGRPPGSVVHR